MTLSLQWHTLLQKVQPHTRYFNCFGMLWQFQKVLTLGASPNQKFYRLHHHLQLNQDPDCFIHGFGIFSNQWCSDYSQTCV